MAETLILELRGRIDQLRQAIADARAEIAALNVELIREQDATARQQINIQKAFLREQIAVQQATLQELKQQLAEASGDMGRLLNSLFISVGSGTPIFGALTANVGALASALGTTGTAVTAALGAFAALRLGIEAAVAAVETWLDLFKSGVRTVADFEQTVAGLAALLVQFGQTDRALPITEQLKQASETIRNEVLPALMEADRQTLGSLNDLLIVFQQLIAQGVKWREALEIAPVLTNAIYLLTQGQNTTMQLAQETRGLFDESIRATSRLATILNEQIGGSLAANIKYWKEQGTLAENLKILLAGFAASGEEFGRTLQGVISSFATLRQMLELKIFKEAFDILIEKAVELRDALMRGGPEMEAVIERLRQLATLTAEAFVALFDAIVERASTGKSALDVVVDALTTLATMVKEFGPTVVNIFGDLVAGATALSKVINVLAPVWGFLWDISPFKATIDMISFVVNLVEQIVDKLRALKDLIFDFIGIGRTVEASTRDTSAAIAAMELSLLKMSQSSEKMREAGQETKKVAEAHKEAAQASGQSAAEYLRSIGQLKETAQAHAQAVREARDRVREAVADLEAANRDLARDAQAAVQDLKQAFQDGALSLNEFQTKALEELNRARAATMANFEEMARIAAGFPDILARIERGRKEAEDKFREQFAQLEKIITDARRRIEEQLTKIVETGVAAEIEIREKAIKEALAREEMTATEAAKRIADMRIAAIQQVIAERQREVEAFGENAEEFKRRLNELIELETTRATGVKEVSDEVIAAKRAELEQMIGNISPTMLKAIEALIKAERERAQAIAEAQIQAEAARRKDLETAAKLSEAIRELLDLEIKRAQKLIELDPSKRAEAEATIAKALDAQREAIQRQIAALEQQLQLYGAGTTKATELRQQIETLRQQQEQLNAVWVQTKEILARQVESHLSLLEAQRQEIAALGDAGWITAKETRNRLLDVDVARLRALESLIAILNEQLRIEGLSVEQQNTLRARLAQTTAEYIRLKSEVEKAHDPLFRLSEGLQQVGESVSQLPGLFGRVGDVLRNLGAAFSSFTTEALRKTWAEIRQMFSGGISGLFGGISSAFGFVGAIAAPILGIFSGLRSLFTRAARELGDRAVADIKRIFSAAGDNIIQTMQEIEARRAQAVRELSGKKGGGEQIRRVNQEAQQALEELRRRAEQIRQEFERTLTFDQLSEGAARFTRSLTQAIDQAIKYVGAGGDMAKANTFLALTLDRLAGAHGDLAKDIEVGIAHIRLQFAQLRAMTLDEEQRRRLADLERRAIELFVAEAQRQELERRLKMIELQEQLLDVRRREIDFLVREGILSEELAKQMLAALNVERLADVREEISAIQAQLQSGNVTLEQRIELERRLAELRLEELSILKEIAEQAQKDVEAKIAALESQDKLLQSQIALIEARQRAGLMDEKTAAAEINKILEKRLDLTKRQADILREFIQSSKQLSDEQKKALLEQLETTKARRDELTKTLAVQREELKTIEEKIAKLNAELDVRDILGDLAATEENIAAKRAELEDRLNTLIQQRTDTYNALIQAQLDGDDRRAQLLQQQLDALDEQIAALEIMLARLDPERRRQLQEQLKALEGQRDAIKAMIAAAEDQLKTLSAQIDEVARQLLSALTPEERAELERRLNDLLREQADILRLINDLRRQQYEAARRLHDAQVDALAQEARLLEELFKLGKITAQDFENQLKSLLERQIKALDEQIASIREQLSDPNLKMSEVERLQLEEQLNRLLLDRLRLAQELATVEERLKDLAAQRLEVERDVVESEQSLLKKMFDLGIIGISDFVAGLRKTLTEQLSLIAAEIAILRELAKSEDLTADERLKIQRRLNELLARQLELQDELNNLKETELRLTLQIQEAQSAVTNAVIRRIEAEREAGLLSQEEAATLLREAQIKQMLQLQERIATIRELLAQSSLTEKERLELEQELNDLLAQRAELIAGLSPRKELEELDEINEKIQKLIAQKEKAKTPEEAAEIEAKINELLAERERIEERIAEKRKTLEQVLLHLLAQQTLTEEERTRITELLAKLTGMTKEEIERQVEAIRKAAEEQKKQADEAQRQAERQAEAAQRQAEAAQQQTSAVRERLSVEKDILDVLQKQVAAEIAINEALAQGNALLQERLALYHSIAEQLAAIAELVNALGRVTTEVSTSATTISAMSVSAETDGGVALPSVSIPAIPGLPTIGARATSGAGILQRIPKSVPEFEAWLNTVVQETQEDFLQAATAIERARTELISSITNTYGSKFAAQQVERINQLADASLRQLREKAEPIRREFEMKLISARVGEEINQIAQSLEKAVAEAVRYVQAFGDVAKANEYVALTLRGLQEDVFGRFRSFVQEAIQARERELDIMRRIEETERRLRETTAGPRVRAVETEIAQRRRQRQEALEQLEELQRQLELARIQREAYAGIVSEQTTLNDLHRMRVELAVAEAETVRRQLEDWREIAALIAALPENLGAYEQFLARLGELGFNARTDIGLTIRLIGLPPEAGAIVEGTVADRIFRAELVNQVTRIM